MIQSQQDTDDSGIRILPYPGGRHPRRGFLDGAIDPQRETKFSVFPPWRDGGYVVVDVPEAIFSNLGLTYLAHTHVPTIWTAKEVELPKLEWEREGDSLTSKRVLPNGITFGSRVERGSDAVKMEMWLTNRSVAPLTGLRTQVCVMLKGAIGFNSQMSLPRVIQEPFIAVRSENSDRWIITAWNSRSRVWSNPPVPCIHSDPFFSDCAPGETVRVHGGLWFYEGKDVERELDRLAQSWDDGNRLKD